MSIEYKLAQDIQNIAEEVIKNNPEFSYIIIDDIVFCRINKHIIGEEVLGRCVFLSDRTQFLSKKRFMFEFPPVFDTLTPEQQNVVIMHELYHIPKEEKSGLIPHNIGEFRKIVEKFGLDWFDTLKEADEKVKLLKQKEKIEKKQKKLEESK